MIVDSIKVRLLDYAIRGAVYIMLKIGHLLLLEQKYSTEKETYKCMIVEVKNGTFFIDYPVDTKTGKVAFLIDGTQLKATYSDDEKGTFLFETEVLNKVKGNIPMIQLLLPPEETFIKIQRRQFVRIETRVDLAIHAVEGEFVPFRAVTDDLSAGGAAIHLHKNITLNGASFVDIWLALPLNSEEIFYLKLRSKVIRLMELENGLKILSVQFISPTKTDTQTIMRFIFEKQVELKKRGLIG